MRRAAAAAAAAVVLLAGCGSEDPAPGGMHEAPAHVHGVGADSRGALYVATHTGLWRAGAEERRVARVGASHRDLMGFTVAADERFLASGHPEAGEDAPPLLGLLESTDGGRTWQTLSLGGEADLHVLRVAGPRIYGFDSASGSLLVSDDGGRSWDERRPPGMLYDLAPHPRERDLVVASGEEGLAVSRDAGRSWRPVAAPGVGLLAWPAPDRLLLIDGAGTVSASADAGRTWERAGTVDGQPAATAAAPDGSVLVALHDATVKVSRDGGSTWAVRAAP